MANLILFHHAQGLTDGIEAFAEQLHGAGHLVTVPDLYGSARFGAINEGVAHAEHLGFDNIIAAGMAVAEKLPDTTVYAGFSLGALVAHKLAQTRPGALGALLYHHGDVPITTFGESWPAGVELHLHINEHEYGLSWTSPGSSSNRPRPAPARSCSSTRAPRICSPTPASPTTSPSLQHWHCGGPSAFSRGSRDPRQVIDRADQV